MADDRKLRLVLKDHDCSRIGEIASFTSFVSRSVVNDVGEATLVAAYGASEANDAVLDALSVADVILEAYIKPPGHGAFLDEPAWAGFLRDARIEQVGPTRVGTYVFKDYNHLLTRRVVVPPPGGSHDEHYGTTSNIMRDLVRTHAAELADEDRQIPGLSVEANDGVEAPGLYSDTTALVFGSGLPEYVRVNDLVEWNGWLYLGTETEPDSGEYAAIYRSIDGTTWTKVMDGADPVEGLYGYPITSINCFCVWDGWLYAGCSQNWEADGGMVMRSFNGDDWSLSATFPNNAGIWALAEFSGQLYAGTTGNTATGSETYLWRTADGLAWNACADATVSGGDCWDPLGGNDQHIKVEALYTWGAHLYLGVMYKKCSSGGAGGWSVCRSLATFAGRIYRTDDGTTMTQVLSVSNSVHGFLSFMEWGDYLYAGSGRNRFHETHFGWAGYCGVLDWNTTSAGRIYRTTTGAAWTQVFGANLDSTHYSDAISDLMVSTDPNGDPAMWAASGHRTDGSARVYYSVDGETWTNGANITTIPYAFTLALAMLNGENYAGMGCYARDNTQGSYGNTWTSDYGDVWRVVLSAGDLAESGATGRWTTLLDKLREIAEQSGNHDFGIVGLNSLLYCDIYQTFEFQVRYPQWGTDNRWDGERGVSFSIQRGNMDRPMYATVRGARPNYLYLLGPSSGDERTVDEYPNAVSMAESPWNRVEGTVNAQGVDTASARNSIGWSELELQGPYREFSFMALETAACYHPTTWKLGDLVTASFSGVLAECKVTEVAMFAMDGDAVYTTQPTFKVLDIEAAAGLDYMLLGAGFPHVGNLGGIFGSTRTVGWHIQATFAGGYEEPRTLLRTQDGVVLAGTRWEGAVWYSEDEGLNWTKAQDITGEKEVMCMVEVPATGTLLLGTGRDAEIWRSTDGGYTWVIAQTLETPPGDNYVRDLCVAANGDILAGGIYPNVASDAEVWRSQDDGQTWVKVDTLVGQNYVWSMVRAANNDLIAGTQGGFGFGQFWRSQDNGANWTFVANMTSGTGVHKMITLSDGTILAGSYDWGGQVEIWRSTTNGASWAKISEVSNTLDVCYSFAEGYDGEVVGGFKPAVWGNDAELWQSTDGGVTWTQLYVVSGYQFPTALLHVEA